MNSSRSRLSAVLKYIYTYQGRSYVAPSGSPGSGVGRGGGGGGSVKESGGGLGQYGAAREEGYFYNKDRKQMEKIKQKLKEDQKDQKAKEPDE